MGMSGWSEQPLSAPCCPEHDQQEALIYAVCRAGRCPLPISLSQCPLLHGPLSLCPLISTASAVFVQGWALPVGDLSSTSVPVAAWTSFTLPATQLSTGLSAIPSDNNHLRK